MNTEARTAVTWPSVLTSLVKGEDLSVDQAGWAMSEMMRGNATDAQIAGFLIALASKGETVGEVTGLADAMLAEANPIDITNDAIDIVGTGGDRLGTVNLSTMSSLVAVGAGARVIKHGNRGSSSTAGAADVIEALGVNLNMDRQTAVECFNVTGITFLFAQEYHPSMRYVAPARKQLGVPTAFNFLGPLSNPARPVAQALGCASESMAPVIAGVLRDRGVRGMVFRGSDGRDKITTSGPSTLFEIRGDSIEEYELDPRDFGIELQPVEALAGKDGAHNATIVKALLRGEEGPVRDAVLLNAGAGLTAYDESADGDLFDRIKKNMDRAAESIDSGAAQKVLDSWVEFSQSHQGDN